jgi:hypothetical protein
MLLHHDLYRGVLMWNRRRKRDRWGQKRQRLRPEQEWLTRTVPHLQIVSDDAWETAHARLSATRRTYQRGTKSLGLSAAAAG